MWKTQSKTEHTILAQRLAEATQPLVGTFKRILWWWVLAAPQKLEVIISVVPSILLGDQSAKNQIFADHLGHHGLNTILQEYKKKSDMKELGLWNLRLLV